MDNEVVVRTSVKHPIARQIMQELDGKVSPTLKKRYTVVFEDKKNG